MRVIHIITSTAKITIKCSQRIQNQVRNKNKEKIYDKKNIGRRKQIKKYS